MSKSMRLLSAFLSLSIVLSLSACGSKGSSANDAKTIDSTAAAGSAQSTGKLEPVKLKLLTISSDESRQKIMNDFIKPNSVKELPNVEIQYEETATVTEKMKIYNASGDLPDVWFSGPQFAMAIINAGNQLNLESYITKDGYLDKFKVKDGMKYKDGIYCLSCGSDNYFNPKIFYHKDIFAKNNIQIPATYDQFVDACKKLSDAGVQPIAAPGKGGWAPAYYLIQNMIQMEDPAVMQDLNDNKTDFTNPVVKNAIERIVALAKSGAFGKGSANLDYGPAKELFTQNKAAMYMMFSWELPDLEKNVKDVDFFPWPAVSDKYNAKDVIQSWGSPLAGYSVSSKSKYIDEAVKLAEFCNKQDALYFESTGSLVSFTTGNPAPVLQPLQQKNIDQFNAAKTKISTFLLNALDTKSSTEYQNLGSNLMTGQYTADQFIEDFNKVWKENTLFK